jgi:hypothetical protein
MSVSGCLKHASITATGHVQMSAPMRAASTMWRGRGAGDENLGAEVEVAEDVDDLLDQVHPVGGDVVEPSDERADVGGADFGARTAPASPRRST